MMNIDDIDALENFFEKGEQKVSETLKTAVRGFLTFEESKSSAFTDPFKWFYEDVIEDALKFHFNKAVGEHIYASASSDAHTCLSLALEVRKIDLSLIFSWVSSALKTIDHIVVHYIQDHLKEPFKKIDSYGVETSRYMQLAEKPQPLGAAGSYLKDIYSIHRNAYEHRTVNNGDGKIVLKQPDKAKCKQQAIMYFKRSLKGILDTYKVVYPTYVIN